MRLATCLILVKRDAPINPVPDNHGGVHHAFAVAHDEYAAALEHLRAHGVEITFEEDRQGGVLNGPRAYFHDPDGTVLEFIDLTRSASLACIRAFVAKDAPRVITANRQPAAARTSRRRRLALSRRRFASLSFRTSVPAARADLSL